MKLGQRATQHTRQRRLAINSPAQPDIRISLDHQGLVISAAVANEVADEQVGSWLGRPWAETVEGRGRRLIADMVGSAANAEVSPLFHLSQRFPSGLVIPVEYVTVPAGEGRAVAIGRDMRGVAQLQSRLAAAQQTMERGYWQLREVENRYRVMFEAASDAMVVLSGSAGVIEEANPAAITVLGFTASHPTAIVGTRLIDRIAQQDRDMVTTTLSRAHDRGKAPRIIVHLFHNGEPWLLRASVFDVERADQLLVQLVPVSDSAEQPASKADTNLSAAEIIESVPDGIVVIDDDGFIVSVNSAFAEMAQCPARYSLVGSSLGDWIRPPGGDLPMLLDGLKDNDTIRRFPTTLNDAGGKLASTEIAASRIHRAVSPMFAILVRGPGASPEHGDSENQFARLLESLSAQVGQTALRDLVGTTTGLVERHFIETALAASKGNRTSAAKLLQLSRQSLYTKLSRYGIAETDDQE
jgi:transcriptional regulator PpsR